MRKLLSAALLTALLSLTVIGGDVNIPPCAVNCPPPPCTENCENGLRQSSTINKLLVEITLLLIKR